MNFLYKLAGIEADPSIFPVRLSAAEASDALATLYRHPHQPTRAVQNSLNTLPLEYAMPFARREEAETQADSLPNGYRLFADKTGYVHVQTEAAISAKAFAWLLPWVAAAPLRFKLLCPGFHAYAEPADSLPSALCTMRCVVSVGADLNGKRVAPMQCLVRFMPPVSVGGGVAFRAVAKTGPFMPAHLSVVLTGTSIHILVWLGSNLSPIMRGVYTEKRLFDIARHCALVGAQAAAITEELYAAYGGAQ